MKGEVKELFDKIRQKCLEKGITIYKLAQISDIPMTTIYGWKDGHMPRIDALSKIANCLETPIEYFIEEKGK